MSLLGKLRSKLGKSAYTSLAVLAFSAGMPIAYEGGCETMNTIAMMDMAEAQRRQADAAERQTEEKVKRIEREELERQKQGREEERQATLTRDLNNNPDGLIRFSYDLSKEAEGVLIITPVRSRVNKEEFDEKGRIEVIIYNYRGEKHICYTKPHKDERLNWSVGILPLNSLDRERFKGICKVELNGKKSILDEFYIHLY